MKPVRTTCSRPWCQKPLTPKQIGRRIQTCSRRCGVTRHAPRQCSQCPGWLTPEQIRRGQKTCSRSCGNTAKPYAAKVRQARMAAASNQRRQRMKVIAGIVADCKPWIAPALEAHPGLLRQVVGVVVKYRRLGYQRGWTAAYGRKRREALAGTFAKHLRAS